LKVNVETSKKEGLASQIRHYELEIKELKQINELVKTKNESLVEELKEAVFQLKGA
jgi:TolA-binding protein